MAMLADRKRKQKFVILDRNVNKSNNWSKDIEHLTDHSVVCSEHFKLDAFQLNAKRRRLIPGAIPFVVEVTNDRSNHVTGPNQNKTNDLSKGVTCPNINKSQQNVCKFRDIDVQTVGKSFELNKLLDTKRSLTRKLSRLLIRFNKVTEELKKEKLKTSKNLNVDYIRYIKAGASRLDPYAIFLLDQIRNYHKKQGRWSEMTLHHCVAWRCCFPNGYEFPRDCFLKLPCKNTLKKYVQADSNKFGQKMLERMGWKEGKGLGRNEDGLTDYVKVAYKNNSKGMGFKDSVEWSAQQDNFNALLGELSNAQNDMKDQPKEIKSLEEKSQNSRARVHYRKFTRGKDLSRYSQKDLANIFGRKKLDKDPEEVAAEIQEEEKGSKGVFTTSGSMVDYFKNKMKSNVNKMKSNEDVNDSGEEQASYGFGFNASSSLNSGDEMTTKKKKKNKQKDTFVSDKVDTKKRKGELSEVENTPSKKLKFEARSKKLKSEDQGLINPAFEPLCSNIPIKKHLLDTINEDEVPSPNECENEKSEIMEESVIEESKPKKKKNKNKTESLALDNPAFNDEVDEDLQQEPKQKKSKKPLDLNISVGGDEVKRKKNKNLKGLDNPALNVDDFENNESVQNFEVKRKKKKSRLTLSESQDNKGIENSALEITDGELVNTTVTPKPNKITPRYKFKNILFSKAKQEIVIPTRSPGDIDKRNELYDINTKVIQDGLRDLKKQPSTSQNFDIKSIDKIDFCDDSIKLGIDNRGFDVRAQTVEESVNSLTKTIDNYQAEVENGINESKMKKSVQEEENEIDEEGVVLQFKHAKFNNKTPAWVKGNDASACLAKKSYKHLIKGDIVVAFKKTNLHQIDGYAITK